MRNGLGAVPRALNGAQGPSAAPSQHAGSQGPTGTIKGMPRMVASGWGLRGPASVRSRGSWATTNAKTWDTKDLGYEGRERMQRAGLRSAFQPTEHVREALQGMAETAAQVPRP